MRVPAVAVSLTLAALLAACSKPDVPERDTPIEPKAAVRHDDLKRAIDAPLQKAKTAQSALEAAQAAQSSAIDAADANVDPQTN